MLVAKRIRIEKDIIVRILRILSGKGKILVSVGQEVTPEEIIGTGEFSGGFRILNLARLLEVSPQESEKYLKRELGSRIYKGELLAYKRAWLFGKEKAVVSPIDGIVDFINKKLGEIRITRLPEKIKLPAGVYGIVESLDNSNGRVVIRTQVSRVYGICGSGKMRDGILHILTKSFDLMQRKMISPKYDANILVNGSLISKDTIMAAISNGVNGIITGGINAKDYKSIAGGRIVFPKKLENDIGISIVVCEGFGSGSIGEDIYEILSGHEGRFVTIDGNKALINLPSFNSSSMINIRKHELAKIESSYEEPDLIELREGQRVRIIGPSYTTEQGKITAIDKSKTLLPSKFFAYLATVETKRRKIRIPINNIEVIS